MTIANNADGQPVGTLPPQPKDPAGILRYTKQRFQCVNHPHRSGERMCARCKDRFCEACFPNTEPQAVCERCAQELADIEFALHPPLRERIRRASLSLRNAIIGLAVLALLAIPGYFVVRDLADIKLTPEEWARFKYAAAGTFQTPDGVMVYSTVLGGQVVSATSESPPNEARRLIDEYWGEGYPGWRSATADFPQEIVIAAPSPTRIERVILAQDPRAPEDSRAREVEILVSTTGPDREFTSVALLALLPDLEPQRFEIGPAPAVWIKLRVLSNFGSREFASLHEFDSFYVPEGPGGRRPAAN